MADDVDKAQDRDEALAPFRAILSRKPEAPAATGHCLNCDDPVTPPRRWCDGDCLTDWEKRQ